MKSAMIVFLLVASFFLPTVARAQSIDALDGVIGYTVITTTYISGETEGADYDKLVKLDNGMIFEWETYDYFYAYHPRVAVFAKSVVVNGKSIILYKLIVE